MTPNIFTIIKIASMSNCMRKSIFIPRRQELKNLFVFLVGKVEYDI